MSTSSERSARLRAQDSLARFDLGRRADDAASLAAKWASKAGTWIGLAELLDFLPKSASWRTVKHTIKAWGRASRPDQKIGQKAADFARDFYGTQLEIAGAVLGSTEGQAALTAAGVPPELTAALGQVAQAGAGALAGLDPAAVAVGAVDASDPMAEDADPLGDAQEWIEAHPIASIVGAAAIVLGGWRALR